MNSTYRLQPARALAFRRPMLAIFAVSLFGSKLVRVYSHLHNFSNVEVFIWGGSFFAQDIILLLFLRFVVGKLWFTSHRTHLAVTAVALLTTMAMLGMAAVEIAFFTVTGSEIHWRHIGVVSDFSGSKMLFSAGFYTFVITLGLSLFLAWMIQTICYEALGSAVHMVIKLLLYPLRKFPKWHRNSNLIEDYSFPDDLSDDIELSIQQYNGAGLAVSRFIRETRIPIGIMLLAQIPVAFIRPNELASDSLTWTLPLIPFMDSKLSSKYLTDLPWLMRNETIDIMVDLDLYSCTALDKPPNFSWLPSDTSVPGFEDWYDPASLHYNSAKDPLRVSNLDDHLLPALKNIADLDVRHVMFMVLESTRSDVFPIDKKSFTLDHLAESYPHKKLPTAEKNKMHTLTPTAASIAGDHSIRASNAFTTSTYTLKSLAGTLCGISPLTVDFNADVSNHIYQPCLPHIFNALNMLDHSNGKAEKDFADYKWKSLFMQSVTGTYDQQDRLMANMGYGNNSFITSEYLRTEHDEHKPVDVPDINYYGMPEVVLEDYMREAFASAARNNERLFLTHLTSSTHHPFEIPVPGDAPPSESSKRDQQNLSKYLSAIGYVDQWVGKILDILDDQGVANETLLVLVGDHGLSLPENDAVTPYDNPNIGNIHVPLILSHPKLPKIEITVPVTSLQILPTLLDILIESRSLSGAQSRAAHDLLRNYEGQSMLRPARGGSGNGKTDWQFTVTNPGGTMISVRDARHPHWRLTAPLSADGEWRFTDLTMDPHELSPVLTYDLGKLMAVVQDTYGPDGTRWLKEAVSVTGWWVQENRRRWRYGAS